MTHKFSHQGFLVTLEDINPDGSLRDDFYDVVERPMSKEHEELTGIINTVKAERSSASITKEQILSQAEHLEISTQEFESFLSKIATRGPELH